METSMEKIHTDVRVERVNISKELRVEEYKQS